MSSSYNCTRPFRNGVSFFEPFDVTLSNFVYQILLKFGRVARKLSCPPHRLGVSGRKSRWSWRGEAGKKPPHWKGIEKGAVGGKIFHRIVRALRAPAARLALDPWPRLISNVLTQPKLTTQQAFIFSEQMKDYSLEPKFSARRCLKERRLNDAFSPKKTRSSSSWMKKMQNSTKKLNKNRKFNYSIAKKC